MKKLILAFVLLFAPLAVSANAELVQIVSFDWDTSEKKLSVVSFGSGTAIDKDLVVTNKHVVRVNDSVADFLLLCPAQAQANRAVKCNVAAGVSAVHRTLDVALVKTLDPSDFLFAVKTSNTIRDIEDVVRVVGFPTPDASATQGFGDTKTAAAFKAWQEDPTTELEIEGDKPTTTRGRVIGRAEDVNSGATYTYTDAKVNFGNSGGAAFDQFGNYIGIPTLKDSKGNSFILEYAQFEDWLQENRNNRARYSLEGYDYYQSLKNSNRSQVSKRTRSSVQNNRFRSSARRTSTTTSTTASRLARFRALQRRVNGTAENTSTTASVTAPQSTEESVKLTRRQKLFEILRAKREAKKAESR